jgi:hypothetical protein
MTASNTEIGIEDFNYTICPYGRYAGEPTVEIVTSKDESNRKTVRSLDRQFNRYNWGGKLRSGFARMRIRGEDPLHPTYWDFMEDFSTVADPRFVDLEVEGSDITGDILRTTRSLVDSYTFIISEDKNYNDPTLDEFAENARKSGDSEFVFKVKSWTDEDWISEVTRLYSIYDSDVWLMPVGDDVDTVAENIEKCVTMAKSNTWNVSPRFDVMLEHDSE